MKKELLVVSVLLGCFVASLGAVFSQEQFEEVVPEVSVEDAAKGTPDQLPRDGMVHVKDLGLLASSQVRSAVVFAMKTTDFVFWTLELAGEDNQDFKVIQGHFYALDAFLKNQKSIIETGVKFSTEKAEFERLGQAVDKLIDSTRLFDDFFAGRGGTRPHDLIHEAMKLHRQAQQLIPAGGESQPSN